MSDAEPMKLLTYQPTVHAWADTQRRIQMGREKFFVGLDLGHEPAAAIVDPPWGPKSLLAGLAKTLGVSYEDASRDYRAAHRPDPRILKASRLIKAAVVDLGRRGQGRKLKRAIRLHRDVYGAAMSHARVSLEITWARQEAIRTKLARHILREMYARGEFKRLMVPTFIDPGTERLERPTVKWIDPLAYDYDR